MSGSWVVNPRNGDLFGVIVAEEDTLTTSKTVSHSGTFMLRARDVFMDIEEARNCSVSLPLRTRHTTKSLRPDTFGFYHSNTGKL